MNEYDQRIIHKIEAHTFNVTQENASLLSCVASDNLWDAANHLANLKYYISEIDTLFKKLVISKGMIAP